MALVVGFGVNYSVPIANSYFHLGENTIDVLLEDHGGSTFFEMELAGNSVPEPDTDEDGFPDAVDQCPKSILTQTVIIGGCNSGVPNHFFNTGCSISDMIVQAALSTRSRGEFVSAVASFTNELKKSGAISGSQKGAIQSCAAKARIP